MKELVVLSGKGGTGKTVVTASLLEVLGPTVAADCDVDASNLRLMVESTVERCTPYLGMRKARVEVELCDGCGRCAESCAFSAITMVGSGPGRKALCDPDACEGCGLCQRLCRSSAIEMVEVIAGEWMVSKSAQGWVLDAYLEPPAQNTGRLVSLLKAEGRALAQEKDLPLMVVDGPPGIACPAIASLSGANLCLLVTEPTLSGLHDLGRAIGLARSRHVPCVAILNRSDLCPKLAGEVEEELEAEGVPLMARIPCDESVSESLAIGHPPTRLYPDSPFSRNLRHAGELIRSILGL